MAPFPVILGVDPGTGITGYGVVARENGRIHLLECGVIRTRTGAPLPARIRTIYEGVVALVDRHTPTVMSVEAVFQGKNVRSALVLGHARGAILLAAALRDVEIAEYSPREIKKAVVGNGNATKDQVGFMVQERLRLKSPPTPADAADGVAAALCHFVLGMDGRISGVLAHRFAPGSP
ncbi:MAG: crossover junction endodeoxyribonuclease RuvC [Gemmatimonadota bacterium]